VDVGRVLLGALGVGQEPLADPALEPPVRHPNEVGNV
jgi:hypothetical protein